MLVVSFNTKIAPRVHGFANPLGFPEHVHKRFFTKYRSLLYRKLPQRKNLGHLVRDIVQTRLWDTSSDPYERKKLVQFRVKTKI